MGVIDAISIAFYLHICHNPRSKPSLDCPVHVFNLIFILTRVRNYFLKVFFKVLDFRDRDVFKIFRNHVLAFLNSLLNMTEHTIFLLNLRVEFFDIFLNFDEILIKASFFKLYWPRNFDFFFLAFGPRMYFSLKII